MVVVVSAVRIGSNIASFRAQRQLANNTSALSKTFEKLSSGLRINRASDDAAGLAIADSLRANSRVFTQGVRNLNDGISLLNIADSAIENLAGIMTRLEELAEPEANGIYGVQQRKALDAEAQALSKEFYRISKATTFNGRQLLGGEVDSLNLQGGVGTSAVISSGVGGDIGTGTFSQGNPFGVGSGEEAIASGDFNGDGILDVVTADAFEDTVSVLLGTGGGNFAARTVYQATGTGGYRGVTVADFDGDGQLDIGTTSDGYVSIFRGFGNGKFNSTETLYPGAMTARTMLAGDLNGDGAADLLVGSSLMLNRGNGTFASASNLSVSGDLVASGDFNGDGILDVAVSAYATGTMNVLLGRGNGTFGAAVSYADFGTASILCGDFNGDGATDLVTSNYSSNTLSLRLGTGNGVFGAATAINTGDFPMSASAGDFNGDGALDLVSADWFAGTASVFIGAGNGSFAPRVTYAVGTNPRAILAGDFSGDGVVDIMTAGQTSGTASLLIGRTRDGVAPLLPFSLKTLADARQALPIFKKKREQLATQRGEIGAFQSRITVATTVLQVTSENLKAAEARIRDADVASESAQLVRLNILQQAASSVLSQANQQPQIALRLLQP